MKIQVVGAGLVGPLMSIYLARKGFDVALHERRGDMRRADVAAGRSINLAVTARGLRALEAVGLKDQVMKIAIPMKGRMIHDAEGKTTLQPYGQKDSEVIYAASRGLLNKMLLEATEAYTNIEIFFNRRCKEYDIAASTLTFDDAKVAADVVIGADGAFSAIRKAMFETLPNYNYAQSFLEYGYKELVIPPGAHGAFQMEKNALHIWPRKNYMMIALPNMDGSFTMTLFYPYEGFAALKTPADVQAFFQRDFPDALALMPTLTEDFFANPTGALMTVKCSPWHAGGRACLIGDAAHAIVPFFAQGMNSGFEDITLLDSLITSDKPDWQAVFSAFGQQRKKDTDAIADMAVENFVEMRDSVTNTKFQLKKLVGFALEKRWPDKFIPRYSMVIFHPEISYAQARTRSEAQDKILEELCANINTPEQLDWSRAEKMITQIS